MVEPGADAQYYIDILRSVFAGRKVIVTADVLAGTTGTVGALRSVGAEVLLAVGGHRGTGLVPDCETVTLGTEQALTIMDNIRAFEASLLTPPPVMREAVERADPDREALVISSFFTPDGLVCDRPVYGGRPDAWNAIEDKVVVDSFFDAAGVARVPSENVGPDELQVAYGRHDRGAGAVFAGDAKEGFNGGATYLRWIRSDDDLDEAVAFYRAHCDLVRVMPFLEGIPCSIHGFVSGDFVGALRPAEMVTLRRPGSKLMYSGASTFWDPPDADREYMREVARRVGRTLQERVDYRGAFTVDGVVTEEGFRPTEINPRVGAATASLTGASGIPFALLNKVLIADPSIDMRPHDLEELLLQHADAHRSGGAWSVTEGEPFDERVVVVAYDDVDMHVVREGEERDAEIALGPSAMGRFVRFVPLPERTRTGPSIAPLAVRAFAFMDREFGTTFGPLEAATDVRRD